MRPQSWKGLTAGLVFICALGFTANALAAASGFTLILQPESRLWLTGDSTLHPYGSTATVVKIDASLQRPAGSAPANLTDLLVRSDVVTFKVTIPVEGLKSGEKGLDKNMYKALKAAEFPTIEFTLTDKRLLREATAPGKLNSGGVLSVAGKENAIQLEGDYFVVPEGLRVRGEEKILMTDYGVKPLTIMGMIKTRNEVVIHFDLILGQPGEAR